MRPKHIRTFARWCAALVGIVALSVAVVAAADPPSRVARLAYAEGTLSFSPAGDDQWVRAVVNRPLVAGDRLWSDQGSRGEMQMTNASLRFGPLTSVSLLNLDDQIEQLEIAQGSLQVQVRRMNPGETVEIDTPNFAFTITRAGSFRFDVDPQDGSTLVAVRSGEGEAYGEGAAYRIAAGQAFRFYGTDLRDHEKLALAPPEGFERWALSRQGRYEGSVAARYVAPEVVGYEDLDQFGTWQAVADYGNVWTPRNVPSGWAPYRYGHWAWIDPWGWTWVDDAPWGFAPFHYGRWAVVQDRWCWVPGPARERAVYAPALVAFVGGNNFSIAVAGGAIGWFPLGPGEVYRPAYSVSREYFTRVNIANTRVTNTYVTNIYNNPNTANVRYAHFQRPTAITAVPQTAFVRAQPVQRAAVAVNAQVLNKAEVLPLATIAPQRTSVTGAAPAVNARPPASLLDKPIVAKAPPPPAPESIATRISRPGGEAGKPLPPPTTSQSPQGPPPNAQAGQGQPPRRNIQVVQAAPPQPAPTTSTPNPGNRPARAEGPADKPRAEAAPPSGGVPAVPPGQQRRVEPPAQASVPPSPPPGAPPGQQRRAEPPAQAAVPPSPPAGGPPGAPPGQQRRAEPPAQAAVPPPPQVGGPPGAPPGQQRRVEPPAQAAVPPSPPIGGPPGAPPGQQRRAEPPAQAAVPPSPPIGGPPGAPPGQQRRAEPPSQAASPPAPPMAPPSVTQTEPRRGPPAERSTPPPHATPMPPQAPDAAAARPAPAPPPQSEPRRGPPAERPAPPPQATPTPPRGPDAAIARPPPQAAPPTPAPQGGTPAPQASPPPRAAQQGQPPREANPGKGRGGKGDAKEGEPKP